MTNPSNAYLTFVNLRIDLLACEIDARHIGEESLANMLSQTVDQVTTLQARFVTVVTFNKPGVLDGHEQPLA